LKYRTLFFHKLNESMLLQTNGKSHDPQLENNDDNTIVLMIISD
jgi:hypothetical protein